MTDRKFTDEEVIKALGICAINTVSREGYFTYQGIPLRYLCEDALDLINRQKAEIAYWQDAAANARREILLEIERLALSKIPEDVEVAMLKDTYYIETLDELMIKYGVTDKNVGCNKEEQK